jgi:NADH dehydrogenase (ubiquinone) 1 alpha subcomplex subunit 5
MKVVDENESIRDIEAKIAFGMIEELIMQAHNEIKLLRIMAAWRPWEDPTFFDAKEDEEDLIDLSNFSGTNPFPVNFESYDDARYDRAPRNKPQ